MLKNIDKKKMQIFLPVAVIVAAVMLSGVAYAFTTLVENDTIDKTTALNFASNI